MEEQEQISNWRDEVQDSSIATLKILDGESATFIFLGEGEKKTHADFGTSVNFEVEHEKVKKMFYVKENNYSFLKQIKALGKLTGKLVKVSRVGSKKSDTRYTIEELNETDQEVKEIASIVE